MIRIAVVEDDPTVRKQLADDITRFFTGREQTCSLTLFSDGDEILDGYTARYDAILLDIQMRRIDGLETAKAIRRMDENVILVFVTNLSEYAIRGYGVRALDFLLTPVNYYMLEQLLERIELELMRRAHQYITLSCEDGMIREDLRDVVFIESDKHNLEIHTVSQNRRIRDTISHFEKLLPQSGFFRCNNGCIVNLAFIERVSRAELTVGGTTLPISRGRYKDFMDALSAYWGGQPV